MRDHISKLLLAVVGILPMLLISGSALFGNAIPLEGENISEVDFLIESQNEVEVVFFGYVGCKYICPTSLFKIGESIDELKEDYHGVMAATFHPAEEDNLEPLKAQYAALATKADLWNKADMPESLQEKGLDKSLQLLAKESKEIGKLIEEGATDEEIKAAIFALHDRFHEIQGKCDDEH